MVGQKLDTVSKLCTARLSNLIDQFNEEKRKRVILAWKKFKTRSNKWVLDKRKSIRAATMELVRIENSWVTSRGTSNTLHNKRLERKI